MGGINSTRWNWHSKKYTVENCCTLKLKTIDSVLFAYWSRKGNGIPQPGCRVIMKDGAPFAVNVHFWFNGTAMSYTVELEATSLPWGRNRYWFNCRICSRRVANLYISPRNPYFACRICLNLTYKSCQEKGKAESRFRNIVRLMQDDYPGITPKEYEAMLEGKYSNHLLQILVQKDLRDLRNLPDPYEHYLTAEELCRQAELSTEDFHELLAIHLLVPDHEGKFRPRLLKWAGKLAYLLNQGWTSADIKHWANGRFHTDDPRQWPPNIDDWRL